MFPLYTKSWAPANKIFIDIGGSTFDTTFDSQLPSAFKGDGYFPKEVVYTTGMHHWCQIVDTSYQTTGELDIIKSTASDVVKYMLATGAVIIDLGAANSRKFVPYVKAFIEQGKPCVYVDLDLCKESLTNHANKSAADSLQITCIGLWGNFIQGGKYFATLPNPRIQTHADIDANPNIAWTYESKLDNSMHYFEVVAQHDMICHHQDDLLVKTGTVYTMFPSWKRGESEIHEITRAQGLNIKTLGKAPNSGMRQYLIQPRI
ncbi:hypothetical protein LZL87_003892 [Fusarium oxysporum]|uniref:4-dimethylallyltryptophan N-methyltransferase easF n=1 Tax=Fusarium oxysporum f. sp. rapae TaxID=485398 RepID=A0A8J5U1P9_FUSOX|nr:4-dimethylallyltryptophan N-methyltransferase easF [Fusarium oxysporum f. sp. rapae]KAI7764687.1 hypothetical protein LZL87_003892 [Fusarium oxysporum]